MVTSIASSGRLDLTWAVMARAVAPAPDASTLGDRRRPPAIPPSVSKVALAPAAMTALIEAQEHLAQGAAPLVRQHIAAKIDQLIARLDDAPQTADAGVGAPFAVRQLRVARDALSQSRIDLTA